MKIRNSIRFSLLTGLNLFLLFGAFGQKPDNAQWTIETTPESIIIKSKIKKGWQLYSSDFDPDLGPVVTTFKFDEKLDLEGEIKAIDPLKKYDDLWGGEYTYFKEDAKFVQIIKPIKSSEDNEYSVKVEYQLCNEEDGNCILYNKDLKFKLP